MNGDAHLELLARLRVVGSADRLKLVRALVLEAARMGGCPDEVARDLVLAVDEACQNVIRHAYAGVPSAEMELEIRRGADLVVFRLRDYGPKVDPRAVAPRDLDDLRPGGLGTHFIHSIMDEVAFLQPEDGRGNILRMVRKRR